MRAALLALLSLLVLAIPARAADETLGPLPGATGLSAYGGWVAYSVPTGIGAYTLRAWHEGVVADVGIPSRGGPFDVDVGPDTSGRPTAIYSRCQSDLTDTRQPPRGCDLFAVTLGGGHERRLTISSARYSEFAPSIWRGAVAFGRLASEHRRAEVILSRDRKISRLGRGSIGRCRARECRVDLPTAWPEQTDLGSRAVAYLWHLSGGEVAGDGVAFELRAARLDGSRARIAQNGFVSATCDFARPFSPNVSGELVLYGYSRGEECESGTSESFRRFDLRSARRARVGWSAPPYIGSLAWDGDDLYWLRRARAAADCDLAGGPATLSSSAPETSRFERSRAARPARPRSKQSWRRG